MMVFLFACVLAFAAASGSCTSKIDVEFVIDGSASISSSDWGLDLDFLQDLVDDFQVSGNATQFGLVQFSSDAKLELSLSGNQTLVLSAIAAMKQLSGGTAIG